MIVTFGDKVGPLSRRMIARGRAAGLMFFGTNPPVPSSDQTRYERVPSPFYRVRVRPFLPSSTSGLPLLWLSAGYIEWTRLEWIALWFRAWRGMRHRIPQARTVQR
jgi:hypothetical protein